jgi:radical SAM protein (TIGR01212 family)
METWQGKRYYPLKAYFAGRYGCRVHRVPVHAGSSCPNRDGTISRDGCVFCNNEAFSPAARREGGDMPSQVASGMAYARRRFNAEKFIIYFQTYSNTYGSVDTLKAAWDRAAAFPDVIGLSVGTRPDCVDEEKLKLLKSYDRLGEVWIEFGIQTVHEKSLAAINRGHTFEDSVQAVRMAGDLGLTVIAHIILGLPGETEADMRTTARALAALPLGGVKIHHLHVVSGTPLERRYREGRLDLPERQAYVGMACDVLERLPPEFVIHRLAGEAARDYLVAPLWSLDKQAVLADIDRELARRGTYQGSRYKTDRV